MQHIDLKNHYLHVYDTFFIDRKNYIADSTDIKLKPGMLHRHNTAELLLAEFGSSTVVIEQSIVKVTAPYLIFYPAMSIHQQINDPDRNFRRYCLSVDKSYFTGEAELSRKGFALELNQDEYELLKAPIELLYRYFSEIDGNYTRIMFERREYLLRLLLAEIRDLTESSRESAQLRGSYIGDICIYIFNHLDERLELSRLAERSFVCKAKLTRDFRSELGMSVGEYIAANRISRAKCLLHTEMSIADIADKCGFSSAAHLIRSFGHAVGMTPAKYRSLKRKD